jgi:hypothetical protein
MLKHVPPALLFPLGAVVWLNQRDVHPVLDPECTCFPQCCLCAHTPDEWATFLYKAVDAFKNTPYFTDRHKYRVLHVVSKHNPQVVVLTLTRTLKGEVRWENRFTVE